MHSTTLYSGRNVKLCRTYILAQWGWKFNNIKVIQINKKHPIFLCNIIYIAYALLKNVKIRIRARFSALAVDNLRILWYNTYLRKVRGEDG